jgi:hypothetical protein
LIHPKKQTYQPGCPKQKEGFQQKKLRFSPRKKRPTTGGTHKVFKLKNLKIFIPHPFVVRGKKKKKPTQNSVLVERINFLPPDKGVLKKGQGSGLKKTPTGIFQTGPGFFYIVFSNQKGTPAI